MNKTLISIFVQKNLFFNIPILVWYYDSLGSPDHNHIPFLKKYPNPYEIIDSQKSKNDSKFSEKGRFLPSHHATSKPMVYS